MQVAIYATEEKRRRAGFDHVLVLARLGEALILRRDRINALWVLPEGRMTRGQSVEETARSALGAAIGEAVFDVYPLCAYGVTDEKDAQLVLDSIVGLETLDADAWFDWSSSSGSNPARFEKIYRLLLDEALDEARAFDRLPLSMQMDRPALILALHKWAGEWFDARITLERLGQPAPF